MDNKHIIESFHAHQTRCALSQAQKEARNMMCVRQYTEQAPSFTPNQLDGFMQRRAEYEAVRREAVAKFTARKKKLPLPPLTSKVVGEWITCRCGEHRAPEFHTCPKCGSTDGVSVSVRVPGPKGG